MNPIRRILLLSTVTLACAAAPASATTYCVATSPMDSDMPCEGPSKPTFTAALSAAEANPGKDRIELGKGPFTGTFSINAGNPVDVVGPRDNHAVLRSTDTTGLFVVNGDSTVENVNVIPKSQGGAVGIDLRGEGAKLQNVGVYDDKTDAVTDPPHRGGIVLRKGGSLRNVEVDLGTTAPGSTGITAEPMGTATTGVDIREARVVATFGVRLERWPKMVAMRTVSVVAAGVGVWARPITNTTIENLSVRHLGQYGIGLDVDPHPTATGDIAFRLRHATLVSRQYGGIPLRARGLPTPGPTVNMSVNDSVLVGEAATGYDMWSGERATIALRRSAWRPSHGHEQAARIVQPDHDNVDLERSALGMPGLAAGKFQPGAGSALIDNGAPGALSAYESPTDVADYDRLVDGDSDGVARRDIGAYEAKAGTSAAPAKVVLIGAPNPPGGGGGPSTPPPVAPPVSGNPGNPPAVAPATVALGRLSGRRRLAGRTTGDVARVQVAIMARKGKRCRRVTAAGRLKAAGRVKRGTCAPKGWMAANGTEAWSLKLARPLPRGAYVVTVRGRDAAGRVVDTASRKLRVGR